MVVVRNVPPSGGVFRQKAHCRTPAGSGCLPSRAFSSASSHCFCVGRKSSSPSAPTPAPASTAPLLCGCAACSNAPASCSDRERFSRYTAVACPIYRCAHRLGDRARLRRTHGRCLSGSFGRTTPGCLGASAGAGAFFLLSLSRCRCCGLSAPSSAAGCQCGGAFFLAFGTARSLALGVRESKGPEQATFSVRTQHGSCWRITA